MLQDLLLFIVGIAVGAMNAFAGGGMLLGFPVLLTTGMPALVANATASIVTLPGMLASIYSYRHYLKKVPRHYITLLIPCAFGSGIGALILRNTSYDHFEQIVPALILFAVALFTFQPYLHFEVDKHLSVRKKTKRPPIWFFAVLFPLAIYGGYFSVGFGFVILAFLGFTNMHNVHRMVALKNIVVVVMSLSTIVFLYGSGLIAWKQGLIMGAGTTIGGIFGAFIAKKISSHSLRFVVISIGLITAGYLFFRTYHL